MHNEYCFLRPEPYCSGEQTPVGAGASDLGAKPGGPTLPEGFAGAGGTTVKAKGPGICGVVGREMCPATAKSHLRWIHITGILCSTARRAGMVDDDSKGEGVRGTASGGGGCGEVCLNDLPDEMALDLVSPRGRDDGQRFLTEGVVPRERTT